jgi:hypothetical protein
LALEIREFQLDLLQRVSEFLVLRSPVGLDEDGDDCGGKDRERKPTPTTITTMPMIRPSTDLG